MSIYTSASGIQGHSDWLGVIGTNVSNSGSIGYQKYEYEFEDYMYKTTPDGAIGMGGGFGSLKRNIENGALVATGNASHLGINGNGYFKVLDADNKEYYSRAGVFNFDKNGVYTDPMGNKVVGFPIDASGNVSNQEEPITLPGIDTVPAEASTSAKIQFNIGKIEPSSPGSLFDGWDNGIDASQHSSRVDFSVYMPSGKKQTVTVYFDAMEHAGTDKLVEYAIGIPPEDDARALGSSTKKGLLMTGAMVFDSSGSLKTMSSLVPSDTPDTLSSWKNATLNSAGLPILSLPLAGGTQNISMDFGVSSKAGAFTPTGDANPLLAGFMESPSVGANASTAYAGASTTERITVDGAAEGYLQNVSFNQFGVLTAQYSNGVSKDLYQLNLYTFRGTDALDDAGNGLYSYNSVQGGEIFSNKPGSGSAGIVQGGYLEQSNVDIAMELTNMIICQTSLTANTKMMTTIDEMLQLAVKL